MQISQKIGQYEVLKTYGKDAAIVTDTMFETTDSYILSFIGSLKKNRIDDATYSIIGAYEKEQFFGDEVTLFLE